MNFSPQIQRRPQMENKDSLMCAGPFAAEQPDRDDPLTYAVIGVLFVTPSSENRVTDL